MPIYTASRISADANVLYPDAIAIDQTNVTYYKGCPFGYETIIIPRRAICGVYLSSGIFFADIVITSSGRAAIEAKGFKKSIAK
ncbi:MAG: hypothetical protein K2K97_09185, partial [Muribaculaceae bacterium]|nr:hypothetical protein [Muribaculaceae bacterium]